MATIWSNNCIAFTSDLQLVMVLTGKIYGYEYYFGQSNLDSKPIYYFIKL